MDSHHLFNSQLFILERIESKWRVSLKAKYVIPVPLTKIITVVRQVSTDTYSKTVSPAHKCTILLDESKL